MTEDMVLCQTGSHQLRDHQATARVAMQAECLLTLATGLPVRQSQTGAEVRLTSPVSFPDGIGLGQLVAEVFWYRGAIRVDIRLEHNRVFASADGRAGLRPCYLNDFVASVTLAPEDELSPAFRHGVLRGVKRARTAVTRHNDQHLEPWNQLHVVQGANSGDPS